jgi:ubiquinone/menaquinone biosynthesis C-methylase UbiE
VPTIDENIEEWGSRHAWEGRGDEWSTAFGGTEQLWWSIVHPRIRAFLPAGRILEIAPGHGRMTQYLLGACTRLTAVDLNAGCVEACEQRFAAVEHLELYANDGRSLPMVDDASIDFAFSFDSLVHVDRDVMRSYLHELARTLAPGGVAFLHHSNAAQFAEPVRRLTGGWAPALGERVNRRLNRNWRSDEVSAGALASMAREAGLVAVVQEKVNWLARLPNDCFSTLTRPGSRWDRPPVATRNLRFMEEARRARELSRLYRWG